MCGFTVREIPTDRDGNVDLDQLRAAVGPQTAGLMLTNPSTLGVFEQQILDIRDIVHGAGGLLYYDGANLNAILGKVKPGDMGFDVIHMNLHKTFSTPHGGGGPGAGPVGVAPHLAPFLPLPMVGRSASRLPLARRDRVPAESIGRLSAHMGNAGVLLRAYVYARLLGREGMQRVAEFCDAERQLSDGASCARPASRSRFPKRRASHEFIVTLQAAQGTDRRHRDGRRQAPARQGLPRADHLLPAAGAGVPADRADRNRIEGDARCVRRRHEGDPGRGARGTRSW